MDTILNNLDTGIKIALLGVLTGPILLLIFRLFGKIISEQKVMRDTKMVDLEVNGLIYSLNVATYIVGAIVIFWLLNHFKLTNHFIGVVSIITFIVISAILFLNLISISIGGFNKLQEVLNKNLSKAVKDNGDKIDKNFYDDMVFGFNTMLRFAKYSIYCLGLISFLNFLTCFIIVKSFGLYWGSLCIVSCLTNIVIISCLKSYKNGERAICDIHLKSGDILEGVIVKCINDSDVYVIDNKETDNEVRIIGKSDIFEIRIKRTEKNIISIKLDKV